MKTKDCNESCATEILGSSELCSCCGSQKSCEIIVPKLTAAIEITTAWNTPKCGGAVTVITRGLSRVPVGSYLWSSEFGYFGVAAVLDDNKITLLNTCNNFNQQVGKYVPPFSTFIVVPNPNLLANLSGIFLVADFTAPSLGGCTFISVSKTSGLSAGVTIHLSTGIYSIAEIISTNVLLICNDAAGITPGIVVYAQNSLGQYQYEITLANNGNIVYTNSGTISGNATRSNALNEVITSNFTNISSIQSMRVFYIVQGTMQGDAFLAKSNLLDYFFVIGVITSAGSITQPAGNTEFSEYTISDAAHPISKILTYAGVLTLPPGVSDFITANVNLKFDAATTVAEIRNALLSIKTTIVGVVR